MHIAIDEILTNAERIDQVLARQALDRPDAIALQIGDTEITYEELMLQVMTLAGCLRGKCCIEPGERIGVIAKNDPAFCVLLLAASVIGAVLVPIHTKLVAPEICFIMDDAAVSVLFADSEFNRIAQEIVPDCQNCRQVVEITPDRTYGGWLTSHPETPPLSSTSSRHTILLQMYTSGTTGRPKGALISQGNILTVSRNGYKHLGPFNEHSVSLVCMPLSHIAGCDWLFFGLAAGCRNVLLAQLDPAPLIAVLEHQRITCTLMVPSVIQMATKAAQRQNKIFPDLNTLTFGASPMPAELLKQAKSIFPSAAMRHVYGMTETTGMFTALPPSELEAGVRTGSCGIAFEDAAVRIADTDGHDVPAGVVGEILCRTPQLMCGYWRMPSATNEAIQDDWFHTGDAGMLDDDGYLYVRDRIKDLVITAGENVYPAEVEDALMSHPSIDEVAVIGIPDPMRGEAVVAVIVPSDSGKIDDGELRTFLRSKLARFKIPRRFKQVGSLPRNASGKVLKHKLREEFRF